MKRTIHQVAVLGSGIMGSRLACHFANCGMDVLLLDIPDPDASKDANTLVNKALATAMAAKPSPLYLDSLGSRIRTGNFRDDLHRLADCDWIIEAIIEQLEPKQDLYSRVETHRKTGSLISTNTSGIPIADLCQGRSEDFRQNFCGTHFFNPPRYLKLLEVIPGPDTDPQWMDFLLHFGRQKLGKVAVQAKDSPAFIANRIGVFGIMALLHSMDSLDLDITAVDQLTGPLIGRPKSATFRTCDVVGLDTLVKVAQGVHQRCPQDEYHDLFEIPAFLQQMLAEGRLGDKTKQGFYRKTKGEDGSKIIEALDLRTGTYAVQSKTKFPLLDPIKQENDLRKRIKALIQMPDKGGEFLRQSFARNLRYASLRIPEICEAPFEMDEAMEAGFGWELGPYAIWDAIGVREMSQLMTLYGETPAPWVTDMLASGVDSFYENKEGELWCYHPGLGCRVQVPHRERIVDLQLLKPTKLVWSNSGCSLIDLGQGVLNFEFHTKMNSIGGEVIAGFRKSIEMAEKDFAGLVISNSSAVFSAGANLGMVFMLAAEQEYEELDMAIRAFQSFTMLARLSKIPVVVAPKGLTLGGGCELSMHADGVQAAAETYVGLVEVGVGVIPGGGGTKEFALRLSDRYRQGDVEYNTLSQIYMNMATAKVATSAMEAKAMGIFRESDRISLFEDHRIAQARDWVLEMAAAGYNPPSKRQDIRVPGKAGMALLLAGVNGMHMGRYISDHDRLIAQKLAYVLCGGDLSYPQLVSEQYLLDLEREAFLSLCGERKTLERIQHMLKTGKALRN